MNSDSVLEGLLVKGAPGEGALVGVLDVPKNDIIVTGVRRGLVLLC